MELLHSFLSEQTVQRIGWVLIHFLWQGVAVAAVMWCVLKMLGKASSRTRYIVACMGLALMVAAPVVTFMVLSEDAPVAAMEPVVQTPVADVTMPTETRVIAVDDAPLPPVVLPEPSLIETMTAKLEASLPYCVAGWFVGVAVLSVWYLGGWCQLQKFRRIGTKAVSDAVRQTSLQLAQRLRLRRAVQIAESALVQVPTVIGWLKPVILLPASALTGLDEMQLTAMIAHELAHVKRCDYLVNIVQTVIEILGFYHPAVWWMSKQIRIERENCCDDVAVALIQNKKDYAGALFTMEAVRAKQIDLAVAANGGHLQNRISRLAGKPENHQKSGWIPSVVTILLVATMLIATSMAMSNKSKIEPTDTNNDIRVYQVNRKVSSFPFEKDLSTPEKAYAYVNHLLADGRSSREVSAPKVKARMPKKDGKVYSEDKSRLKVEIVEVRIFRETYAYVIAKVPQLLKDDYNVRHFLNIAGNWLNLGEGGTFTLNGAREDFVLMYEMYDREDNPLDYSDEIKEAAKLLFQSIIDADYKSYLNSKKKTWWNNFPTWNNYTALKWHDELVKWICKTFKENPVVDYKLGEVFTSDVKAVNLKNLPAVSYKLTLEDGGIIEGVLPFRYFPERKGLKVKRYWQGLHGIDWHLQDEPIKRLSMETETSEEEKLNSMGNLKQLALAWFMYADDNDDDIADTLDELKPYLESDEYSWLAEHAVLLEILSNFSYIRNPSQMPIAYDKTFLAEHGRRIVAFADGHVEIDKNDGLKELLEKAIKNSERIKKMHQLKDAGLKLWIWANEHDDVFPDSIEQVEFDDEALKEWAIENVAYLAAGKAFSDIKDTAKEVIAYDRNLCKTDDGTNLLFADGHVEYVEKENLNKLFNIDLVEKSLHEDVPEQLILKIVDESGKAVSGAIVGTSVRTRDEGSDLYSKLSWSLRGNNSAHKPTSNEDGIVTINPSEIILEHWKTEPKAVIYVMHEARKLGAFVGIFSDKPENEMTITLKPLCHIHGKLVNEDFAKRGYPLQWTNVYLRWKEQTPCDHMSDRQEFEFWVPPGQYELMAYGSGGKDKKHLIAPTKDTVWTIEISDGQSELDLGDIDLPSTGWAEFIGKQAPEIGPVKTWENGSPVTLKQLIGHPVVLYFDGDSPNTRRDLPKLVELHDQFTEQGLVIISLYNSPSLEALEQKWEEVYDKYGGVKGVPFRIAIDGNRSERINIGNKQYDRLGATYNTYDINAYPTTILIDPQGRIVGEVPIERIREILQTSFGMTSPVISKSSQPWEKVFYEVYRLEDGKILKRIAPPFIPERKDFYYEHDPDQAAAIPEPPDYFTFHWDGELKSWGCGFVGGNHTLDGVLRHSLSIPSDQFEGPTELLKLKVPGDWIVRKGATDTEKMQALETILQQELGKQISFQKRQVTRPVIVAKGTYRFTPPQGTYDDEWVHFYADKLDPDEGSGGGTAGTVHELISVLGQQTGLQVIDETKNSSQVINQPYGHHQSSRLRGIKGQGNQTDRLNLMLRNLEKQTNLKFTVEERLVSKWFIVDDANQSSLTMMGGGMGGFGGAKPEGEIKYPQNWAEIDAKRAKKLGLDPNEHWMMMEKVAAEANADPNQMRWIAYAVTDLMKLPTDSQGGGFSSSLRIAPEYSEQASKQMEKLKQDIIPNFNLKRNIFIRSITPHGVSDSLNICEVYC